MELLNRLTGALRPPPKTETKSIPAPNPSYMGLDAWVSPPTAAGPSVTPSTAMRCAVVNQCVSIIADAIATLPAAIFHDVDGVRERADDLPASTLIRRDANAWTSAAAMRGLMARDALLTGNAFAILNRLDGLPVELNRVSPHAVQIEISETGEPTYRINLQNGGAWVLGFEDVLHITSGTRADDGVTGIPPISLARESIAFHMVMESTAANVFANNARPGGALQFPKALTEEAHQRIAANFNARYSGSGVGRTLVLEDGASFQTIQQPFSENEFGATWREASVQICRAFGVPPSLAFEMGRATWSNSVEMRKDFVAFCLMPHLAEWQAAYRRVLIDPQDRDDYFVRFDLDEYLRPDLATRADAVSKAISSTAMTPNEARRYFDLPPIEGGGQTFEPVHDGERGRDR